MQNRYRDGMHKCIPYEHISANTNLPNKAEQ